MLQALKGLITLCESWGGRVELVSPEAYREIIAKRPLSFSDAPFSSADLGIVWRDKRIIYSNRIPVPPCDLIHEMGHVFASVTAPSDPNNEEVEFFGWEYLIAKLVGVPYEEWRDANRHYMVTIKDNRLPEQVGDLTDKQLATFLEANICKAEDLGIVLDGKPIAIR